MITSVQAEISSVMIDVARQRCRVHFMRHVLARVTRTSSEMIAAAIRTIFAQPDAGEVRTALYTFAAAPLRKTNAAE